jgi:hypothetical protein
MSPVWRHEWLKSCKQCMVRKITQWRCSYRGDSIEWCLALEHCKGAGWLYKRDWGGNLGIRKSRNRIFSLNVRCKTRTGKPAPPNGTNHIQQSSPAKWPLDRDKTPTLIFLFLPKSQFLSHAGIRWEYGIQNPIIPQKPIIHTASPLLALLLDKCTRLSTRATGLLCEGISVPRDWMTSSWWRHYAPPQQSFCTRA